MKENFCVSLLWDYLIALQMNHIDFRGVFRSEEVCIVHLPQDNYVVTLVTSYSTLKIIGQFRVKVMQPGVYVND